MCKQTISLVFFAALTMSLAEATRAGETCFEDFDSYEVGSNIIDQGDWIGWDGDRYLAVASMGGAPKHPSWYFNLLADPAVTIQDRAETHHLTARIAIADEKAELWPKAVAEWPDYEKYQAKTERDIPLVICE